MTDAEVLDREALERLREWGGERLLSQMVRLFIENSPVRMAQIRTGLRDGGLKETEMGAHSLKSSAANVGAQTLRALAADMEKAASGGDRSAVEAGLPNLEDAFAKAISALEAVEKGLKA
jgi:HPt (histidine-containing phosphotransfer) domain-containing protein